MFHVFVCALTSCHMCGHVQMCSQSMFRGWRPVLLLCLFVGHPENLLFLSWIKNANFDNPKHKKKNIYTQLFLKKFKGFSEKVGMFCKGWSFWKMPGFHLTGSFECQAARQHAERWDAFRDSFPVIHQQALLPACSWPVPECKCSWRLYVALNATRQCISILEDMILATGQYNTGLLVIPTYTYMYTHSVYSGLFLVYLFIYLFPSLDNLGKTTALANCRHVYFLQEV